jgi:hypothetical protein
MLDHHVPRVVLYSDGGSPTINENSVVIHEITGDVVIGNESNQVNINWRGLIFECYLPAFDNNSNELYIGGYYHGAGLTNTNKIYFYNNNDDTGNYNYTPGDLYRQYYDTEYVYFSLNGEIVDRLPVSTSNEYVYIGLDTSNETSNTYEITNILFYETGKLGRNGINGNNGNKLISGSDAPYSVGNYNDIYNDITTNNLYVSQGGTNWNRLFSPITPGVIKTLSSGGTTKLWDFINNNFSNILAYVVFAADSSARVPVKVVQIAMNIQTNRLSPHYNVFGTLPSNVNLTVVNNGGTEQSVNLHSTGAPAYNYIGVRYQIIN